MLKGPNATGSIKCGTQSWAATLLPSLYWLFYYSVICALVHFW